MSEASKRYYRKLRAAGKCVVCRKFTEGSQCQACYNKRKCEHGKRHDCCRTCHGSQFCEHDKRRSCCKICHGSQICEHNKFRGSCKACGGNTFCKHNKERRRCKECNPIGAYNVYHINANKRKHKFEISFEQYEIAVKQPCYYCGFHDEINGLDQIVAGAGYTTENIAPCCFRCNARKSNSSATDFLDHCARITDFQRSKS